MKRHAIIPIFIPHLGCPNDCVFCNQKKITAKSETVGIEKTKEIIESHLETLENRGIQTIEIAFFGGSFTGLPLKEQSAYLAIAKEYKDSRRIDKIHLSTRPDYINKEILENLKKYSVDIIELGVQSFDEEVLKSSNRGHNKEVVYASGKLIKEYGFELGLQLMIGLPKDTRQKSIFSAEEAVKIKPSIARIYPTIIINDTELQKMYERGDYKPLPLLEAVETAKEMYKILTDADINVIRVGLKSTDIISQDGEILGDTFHPAFAQLVTGEIAKEFFEKELEIMGITKYTRGEVDFISNSKSFSNMSGNGSRNKKYFRNKYPLLRINYKSSEKLNNNEYKVRKCNMEKKVTKAVVTVIGKDNVGILAKVSTVCASANANVIEVTQTVLDEYFCMIMIIDIAKCSDSIDALKGKICDEVKDMTVHVMHEDIFNSMHRI